MTASTARGSHMPDPSREVHGRATATMCRWLDSGNAYLCIASSAGRWQLVLSPPGEGRDPRRWLGKVRTDQLGGDHDVIAEPGRDLVTIHGKTFSVPLSCLRDLIERDVPMVRAPALAPRPEETPMTATPTKAKRVIRDIAIGGEARGDAVVPGLTPPWVTSLEVEELYAINPWRLSDLRGMIRRDGTDGGSRRLLSHADIVRTIADGRHRRPRSIEGCPDCITNRERAVGIVTKHDEGAATIGEPASAETQPVEAPAPPPASAAPALVTKHERVVDLAERVIRGRMQLATALGMVSMIEDERLCGLLTRQLHTIDAELSGAAE